METRYSYSAHAHWTQHKRGILEVPEIPRTIILRRLQNLEVSRDCGRPNTSWWAR